MVQRLYQLWYIDLEARRRFQVWTILVAFAYGLFNSLGLGRPEKQVTLETLGVVLFLTAAFSVFYCLRKSTSTETSTISFTYAHLGEVFRQNRTIFEVGLSSLVVLLALSVISRLPNSRVQAAGIDMRLSRAIYSPNPFDINTFNELTTIFHTATTDRVSINPQLMNVAGKRVADAYREDSRAWPVALALLSYRSSLNDKTSSYRQGSCIQSSALNTGVEDLTIINCPNQVLDYIAWKNVVFENSTVVYHGGPAILENVQFKHCQFSFDYTPESQELAKSLTTSNTVTITLLGR
jgi:hypothetical protein